MLRKTLQGVIMVSAYRNKFISILTTIIIRHNTTTIKSVSAYNLDSFLGLILSFLILCHCYFSGESYLFKRNFTFQNKFTKLARVDHKLQVCSPSQAGYL